MLRSIYLDVVSGTGSETPVVPTLTRNETTYELGLASIYIAANATEITQANITDLRFDNNYCGVVTGVIDTIDTTALFAQYEKAWYDFVAQLDDADPEKITINTADEQARTDIAILQTDVADAKARVPFKILCGLTSGYRVTFDEPFSEIPTVVVSPAQSQGSNTTYVVSVSTKLTTGFDVDRVVIDTTASIAKAKSASFSTYWIAIGI